MEEKNMAKLLEEQNRLLKRQSRILAVMAVVVILLCLTCLVSLFLLVPRAENLLSDMQIITSELSEAHLGQTLEQIQSVDLDTLNKAIADLYSIIEPLARFFSR